MGVYEFEGRVPSIALNGYVDEDAQVTGDVRIHPEVILMTVGREPTLI